MVLGPLMLQMGLLPQVSTATIATMIVLTSSYVALLSVVAALVPVEYAVFFMSLCFLGTMCGKRIIDRAIKRYKADWVLIFILATIITVAVIMISLLGTLKYVGNGGCFEGAQALCMG